MRRRWSIPLTALVLVTGSAATAATATAEPAAAKRPAPLSSTDLDMGWSGYMATGGTFTSVSANWTEPTVDCGGSSGTSSSFMVGLGNSSVVQIGTSVKCNDGLPQHLALSQVYPYARSPWYNSDPVSAGDKLTGSVTHNGNDDFTLTLTDSTKGWTQTVDEPLSGIITASSATGSAEVMVVAESAPKGGFRALSDFKTVNFTGATVDGAPLGNSNPVQVIQNPNKVSSLNGGAFSETWTK